MRTEKQQRWDRIRPTDVDGPRIARDYAHRMTALGTQRVNDCHICTIRHWFEPPCPKHGIPRAIERAIGLVAVIGGLAAVVVALLVWS